MALDCFAALAMTAASRFNQPLQVSAGVKAASMAAGQIEILGDDVFCSIAGGGREARFPLTEARPKLADWAKRYDKASERNAEGELAAIGREMYDWLDREGWASAWANALGDDRNLDVKVGGGVGQGNRLNFRVTRDRKSESVAVL